MERTHRLGGTFEIASTPGKGTVAKLGGLAPDL
jgi:signal transduction histidine kinase